MRKTKRFAPLLLGALLIYLLSVKIDDRLLVEHLFTDGSLVMGSIVLLYALAIFIIINGLKNFKAEFDQALDALVALIHRQMGVKRRE